MMEKYGVGGTYSLKGLWWLLMHWVVCKNWPYTIIDNEKLNEVFQFLHGQRNIPHVNTLEGDIKLAHG